VPFAVTQQLFIVQYLFFLTIKYLR